MEIEDIKRAMLNEVAAQVEKSGTRFRIALEREHRRRGYLAMQKRIQRGERMLAYDAAYNKLFVEFGAERFNIGQSSAYHAEALSYYARKAWRLALELLEVEV